MQSELQKQMTVMVQVPVAKEGKRLEGMQTLSLVFLVGSKFPKTMMSDMVISSLFRGPLRVGPNPQMSDRVS